MVAISGSELRVSPDLAALSRAAAQFFSDLAAVCAKERGRFSVALSGGSTPKSLYAMLADAAFRDAIPWPQVHFFWGDERCVPPDDPESNYRMVREALLSRVPIPESSVHRMKGEDPDPQHAALEYEAELRRFFHPAPGQFPRFDLVLMGLGEEGHTASLFPGSPALREHERLVVAPYVEKLHGFRITMTLPVLNAGANVLFLVAGEKKADILKTVLLERDSLPAQLVRPREGRLLWFADAAAADKVLH